MEDGEEAERWRYITALDDEMLAGGLIVSEYVAELIRNADLCYVHGAHVAGIVMASAVIETVLRSERSPSSSSTFAQLIETAGLDPQLSADVHAIRRYRNSWVHVKDPTDDSELLDAFDQGRLELDQRCREAVRTLRRIVYLNQGL